MRSRSTIMDGVSRLLRESPTLGAYVYPILKRISEFRDLYCAVRKFLLVVVFCGRVAKLGGVVVNPTLQWCNVSVDKSGFFESFSIVVEILKHEV